MILFKSEKQFLNTLGIYGSISPISFYRWNWTQSSSFLNEKPIIIQTIIPALVFRLQRQCHHIILKENPPIYRIINYYNKKSFKVQSNIPIEIYPGNIKNSRNEIVVQRLR